ncbi:uncharacterized protein OCT59_002630 [Rhizophagus irregularis]|uniref:uncharacterized protein n=1 Tax=Rhizophagus irregularis TaxID=588596 RepID=UPI001C16F022|nr:hypothetical protein OCT59_002630 [Rhizophagus irregularis]CAB4492507.1 unnamed protein product [Rhizophagus irregularis]
MKMMEAIYKSTMEEKLGQGLQMKSQQELFGKNNNYKFKRPFISNQQQILHLRNKIEPTSTHIGNSKEVVEEFTNLNGDFSKRLPMKPLLSTKPKEDNVSSDDSDETKESNKKKRKIRN